jgi:hypothetical protein
MDVRGPPPGIADARPEPQPAPFGVELSNTPEVQPGVNRGEIYAFCTGNTRIEGSSVSRRGTNSGTGTATDTNGDICKILFRRGHPVR